MLGKIIGAIIGSKIDQRDGDRGVKGAIIGATVAGAMRRLGPLGLVLGGAYVGKKLYDKRKAGKTTVAPAE
jgi:hypothetical protein